MRHQIHRAFLILALLSTLLLGAAPAPLQDDLAEDVPNATGEFTNFIYLPIVNDLEPWPNPMSVETHRDIVDGSTIATRISELNLGWVRLTDRLSWRELQPNSKDDPIDWSLLAGFENELRVLKQQGIKPVVVINDSPRWATIYPTSCSAIRSDKFEAYANFLVQMINHFKDSEFDVHDWELGNEPEVDPDLLLQVPDSVYGCWGEIDDPLYGGEYYGEMLKAVAPYIRSADPQAKIWIGGLILSTPQTPEELQDEYGTPEQFFRGILEAGAAPYFDIVAFHGHTRYWGPYTPRSQMLVELSHIQGHTYYLAPLASQQDIGCIAGLMCDSEMFLSGPWNEMGGGIRGKVKYLRDVMSEYNVDKPLVINEVGIGCQTVEGVVDCDPPPEEFLEFQADMQIRVATRILSDGVTGFTWYMLEGPGWRHQGLLDANNDPKKVFASYQEFNTQLMHTKYLRPVDYSPEIEAYAFERGADEMLIIVWTKNPVPEDITIPQAVFLGARMRQGYNIVDINPVPVGTDYRLSVGFSPIFLTIRP